MERDMGIVILTEVVKNILESSESSSESEEDILFRNVMNDRHLPPRPRCKDYMENVPLYSDEEFQMHFR